MTVGSNFSSNVSLNPGNESFLCPPQQISNGVKAIKTLAYCFIILFSLIGNSLVIAVIYRNRRMSTNTNRFIINMCISDLFVTICVLPSAISRIFYDGWLVTGVIGNALCKLLPFLQDVSAAVSIFSMTVIALDRFYAIVLPMRVHFMTRKRCFLTIAFIWTLAALIHLHYLITFEVVDYDSYDGQSLYVCQQSWEPFDNAKAQRIYYPVVFTLLYALPLVIISILYCAVVLELTKNQRLIDQVQRRQRNKENREVSMMLITVVALFAVSWAPMNVFAFLMFFTWDWNPPCYFVTLKFVADFLIHSNCAQNAFIYFTFNKRYRHGIKEIISSYCGPENMVAYQSYGTSSAATRVRVKQSKTETAVELHYI